jgi:hypothetical protein
MNYQWILTLQWNDGVAQRVSSRSGILVAQPGDTRNSLLARAHAQMCAATGAPSNSVIVFFNLAPDELEG